MARALPETFDYIVVGAGSAGAIVATRLSENPDTTVLLTRPHRVAGSARHLFNHLEREEDRVGLIDGMRMAKKIAEAMPVKKLNIRETEPGPEGDTDEGLLAYIRANADTAFHFCGTARMGRVEDDMTVVDPQLRVKGVQGLRVIDASVMPTEASANIDPAVLMIGEKGADLVRMH